MIRINLLPHRELKRQARRKQFGLLCFFAALVGAGIVGLVGFYMSAQISAQNDTNNFIRNDIKKLDDEIKEIAKLRDEIEGLKARQKAVEDLQSDRNLPVYVLDELVKNTPDGIYLRTLRQTGGRVSLNGYAANNAKVADYVRNLANNSPYINAPELVEIKAISVGQGASAKRLNEFTMNVSIRRPQAPAPAPAAAPKPAAPAKT
jgi:type IV pilus assembly protein PilN